MKHLFVTVLFLISFSTTASSERSLICRDAEFGAGHLKLIIVDLRPFYTSRESRTMVKAEFWVKGKKYIGILEEAAFMPDWSEDSGWYRSTPSPLDYSLCNWKQCPVRKVKLMVHTRDQLKAEGNIRFVLQTTDSERFQFDRKLHCEIKQ